MTTNANPPGVSYALLGIFAGLAGIVLAILIISMVLLASSTAEPSPSPTPAPADALILEPPAVPEALILPEPGEETDPPAVASTSGWATWCAPTPDYCHGWGRPAMLGAVPSFSYGDRPYSVLVRHGGKSVVVNVVSFCACGDRDGIPTVIDLSPEAFIRLAGSTDPGRIRVAVEPLGALPATDADR